MKKRLTILALFLVAAFAAAGSTGPANAATVRYDYDRDVNFTPWRTFAWAVPVNAAASIQERRLARAVEAGFTGRGYTLVADPRKADFLVDFEAAAWRDVRFESSWNGPAFGRTARVTREPKGALVVRVANRATGRLAWHGVVSDDLAQDPAQADKRTAKAVAQLLKKFPARGGAK